MGAVQGILTDDGGDRTRRSCRVGFGLIMVALTLVLVQLSASSSLGRGFPPYVVADGSAVLGSGHVRGFPWVAFLAESNGRPCVEIEMATEGVELCEKPLPLSVATLTTRRKSGTRSVIALMGEPAVQRVYLNFEGRRDEKVVLHKVSPRQVRASNVSRRLKVAARARYGPFCLRRYAAYGSGGRLLFKSQRHSCD